MTEGVKSPPQPLVTEGLTETRGVHLWWGLCCLPRPLAILRLAWDGAAFQGLWPPGTQTLIHRWHSPETIRMKAPPWLFPDLSGQSLEEAPS